jgi:hypothetical protein
VIYEFLLVDGMAGEDQIAIDLTAGSVVRGRVVIGLGSFDWSV